MKIAMFDTHAYDRGPFLACNASFGHDITFLEPRLTRETASLARGHEAVCSFVNDRLDFEALDVLQRCGVRLIALRSAGFNHVDVDAAKRLGISVVRVPDYSPYAVAEHAVALLLTLNRKIHRANNRVREWNFALDGLVGYDLHGKTVGVIGTGKIGAVAARIFAGFGCDLIAFDLERNDALIDETGIRYVALDQLFRDSDVITLHVPLTPETHHLVDAKAFDLMKSTAVVVNTGRGGLIDARALIGALKAGRIGGAALDVYEEEQGIFFNDLSTGVLHDDVLARLLTFPNVLVTAHQGFLTREALASIARTTLENVTAFERGEAPRNIVETRRG